MSVSVSVSVGGTAMAACYAVTQLGPSCKGGPMSLCSTVCVYNLCNEKGQESVSQVMS